MNQFRLAKWCRNEQLMHSTRFFSHDKQTRPMNFTEGKSGTPSPRSADIKKPEINSV